LSARTVGVGAAGVVLLPFVAYAFLAPATYRASADVAIAPAPAASKQLAPDALVQSLRAAVVPKQASGALLESPDGRTVSIVVEDRSATRAKWYANAIAQRTVARVPLVLDSGLADRRKLEKARDERALELAKFLSSHPEVATAGEQVRNPEDERATGRAFAALEAEYARIKAELARAASSHEIENPYPNAASPPVDTKQLARRAAEIEAAFIAMNAKRKALADTIAPDIRKEFARLLESITEARTAAESAEPNRATTGARIVNAAALPTTPIRPDRPLILLVGTVTALFAFLVGVSVRRRPREAANANADVWPSALSEAGAATRSTSSMPPRPRSSWPPPREDAGSRKASSFPPPASAPAPRRSSSFPPPAAAPAPRQSSSFPPPVAEPAPRQGSSFPPPAAAPAANASSFPPATTPPAPRESSSRPPAPEPIAMRAPSSPPPAEGPRPRPPSDPPVSCLVMAHRVPPEWGPEPSLRAAARRTWSERLVPLGTGRGFVLGVSSSGTSVGHKARIATELAIALAEHQKARVLLLEADFGDPSLHRWLRVEMPPYSGFSEQLAGRVNRTANPHWYVVHCTDFLHVLVEGSTHAPELILSRHFEESLLEFREYYDLIVLNAPSITQPVECRAVSDVVDGVAIVTLETEPLDPSRTLALFPGKQVERVTPT
jgi:Mrp family chromosome partitioning ATPase